jgi:hypothetical protein
MKIILLVLGILPIFSIAQRNCHTMENLNLLLQEDEHYLERLEKLEQFTQHAISSGKVNQNKAVITIPVVVHVVYNTSSQNISDAQIQSP